MSAWQGDISELGRLAENLGKLSRVPSVATRQASEGISAAIDDQFAHGIDPYGIPWNPLMESTIERKGSSNILIETSNERDTVSVRPSQGAGITVVFDAEYAGFQQSGFTVGKTKVEPRPVLPYDEIPDTWTRAIADALDDAFDRAMS